MYAAILAASFQLAAACISGAPGGFQASSSQLFHYVLGSNVRAANTMSYSDYGAVHEDSDLNCQNFDSSCKWRNLRGFESKQVFWSKGVGMPDRKLLKQGTGTDKLPKGSYGLLGCLNNPTAVGILASAPIDCQKKDGELRFKHWTSPEVFLVVCVRELEESNYEFCTDKISSDHGPAKVTLPKFKKPFEIHIRAENFVHSRSGHKGGYVILDDIEYDAKLCKSRPERDHSYEEYNSRSDSASYSRSYETESRSYDRSLDSRDRSYSREYSRGRDMTSKERRRKERKREKKMRRKMRKRMERRWWREMREGGREGFRNGGHFGRGGPKYEISISRASNSDSSESSSSSSSESRSESQKSSESSSSESKSGSESGSSDHHHHHRRFQDGPKPSAYRSSRWEHFRRMYPDNFRGH